MRNQDQDKRYAIMTVIQAIGHSHLMPSDVASVDARPVDQKFPQDSCGVRIQFTISWHALGKIMDQELSDALSTLGIT